MRIANGYPQEFEGGADLSANSRTGDGRCRSTVEPNVNDREAVSDH